MKHTLVSTLVLAIVLAVGCSATDILELVAPDLVGTWDSQVTNGATATLTGCTGNLAALEGQTFDQALSSDMFCTVSGNLSVVTLDDTLVVELQLATCDSGSTANVTGTVNVGESTVSGQFLSANLSGVTTNAFSGTVSGNTLSVQQSSVDVSGDSCNFSPPLATTITIN